MEIIFPKIENDVLENEISNLNKLKELPIEIDEFQLGKQNPYL